MDQSRPTLGQVKILGLGAGGHLRVMLETLRVCGIHVDGLLDPQAPVGTLIDGVPVLGPDSLLSSPPATLTGVFLGIGSTVRPDRRTAVYQWLRALPCPVLAVIHPSAIIASTAHVGAGVTVLAGAYVGPGARLGDNVLVNTGAIVEHDCQIGDHVHIATGAKLAGSVTVGAGSHIGIGAVIRQGIIIGQGVIVGAGAVVVKPLPDYVVAVGVPARMFPVADWGFEDLDFGPLVRDCKPNATYGEIRR